VNARGYVLVGYPGPLRRPINGYLEQAVFAPAAVSSSAVGSTSSIRVPFLREGENRGEVREASGLVRLNDPGGERVSLFRSSFVAVKKSGMSLGVWATSTNVRKICMSGTYSGQRIRNYLKEVDGGTKQGGASYDAMTSHVTSCDPAQSWELQRSKWSEWGGGVL